MKKAISLLVIGSAFALTAWWLAGGTEPAPKAAVQSRINSQSQSESRGSAIGASMPAAPTSPVVTPVTQQTAAALTPAQLEKRRLVAEFDKATDLKALYDKYANSTDPAQRYMAAKALLECAEASRQRGRTNYLQTQRDVRVSATDPKATQRNAAFDALLADRCQGFTAEQLTPAAINAAMAEAARMGDPAARAAQARGDINNRIMAAARQRQQYTLTESDLGTLQEAIKSRDPEALRQIGDFGTLWNRTEGLRVGPDQSSPSAGAWRAAWQMMACDGGLDCGAEHRDVLTACALEGACGAPNYQSYLQQFAQSPYQYQETLRFQALIRSAIEQGRWDWLGIGGTTVLGMRPPPAPQTPPKK
ncbi:MAG: hypothetical protein JNM76_11985 [Betaproteobacteria bacterium]|nr:hypothetical protein [Betaproteobacteria bacterium]